MAHQRLETLRELASRFRSALERCDRSKLPVGLREFPRGACADASLLLSKYLEENGHGKAVYVRGADGTLTRAWLELDGITIDIAADQFEGVEEPVIVASASTWHQRFAVESRDLVSLEDYDSATRTSLAAAYRALELERQPVI